MNNYSWLIIFCARYLIFLLPLPALFFLKNKERSLFWRTVLSAFVALAISEILKYIIQSPRPSDITLGLLGGAEGASFPSSHTSAAMAIACSYWFRSRLLGAVCVFLAALVGFGRVLGGVHYPLDILVGLIVGLGSASFIHRFIIYKKR